jgi:hypothetical protein
MKSAPSKACISQAIRVASFGPAVEQLERPRSVARRSPSARLETERRLDRHGLQPTVGTAVAPSVQVQFAGDLLQRARHPSLARPEMAAASRADEQHRQAASSRSTSSEARLWTEIDANRWILEERWYRGGSEVVAVDGRAGARHWQLNRSGRLGRMVVSH